ncbi:MAG: InlB B-repeat-containing protein [Bacillota bacterium]
MVGFKRKNIVLIGFLILLLFLVGCSDENNDIAQSEIKTEAENGQISLDPDKNLYEPGETVTAEATSDSNYEFAGWIINGDKTSEENPTQINMEQAIVTVEAAFEKTGSDGSDGSDDDSDDDDSDDQVQNYTVKARVADGSTDVGAVEIINAETNETIDSGSAVEKGTMIKVEANAKADNYQLTEWSINGETISGEGNNPYVIDSLDENVEIEAAFDDKVDIEAETTGIISGVEIKAYDIEGNELGTLYQNSEPSDLEVDAGQEVILTATTESNEQGLYAWRLDGKKKYEQVLSEIDDKQGIKIEASKSFINNDRIEAMYSPIVYDSDYETDIDTIWGAVREGKEEGKIYGPLTEKDLSEVTYLNATGYDISDLDTVTEYLDNLRTLILRRTDVSVDNNDLETISKLKKLKTLNINNPDDRMSVNRIDGFSKLDKLSDLETLRVRYNKVGNVDFIQNMTDLKELDLLGNDIRIVQPLVALEDNLETVNLKYNKGVYITENSDEAVPAPTTVPIDELEDLTGLSRSDFDSDQAMRDKVELIASGNNSDLHRLSGLKAHQYPIVTTSSQGDGSGRIVLTPGRTEGKYYYPQSRVTLDVQADEDSQFVEGSLKVNGSSYTPGEEIVVSGNLTIEAKFTKSAN